MTEVHYGIALDIGTTELGGVVMEFPAKRELGRGRELNDQRAIGADVMSRLDFATKTPDGGGIMKKLVMDTANRLISRLIEGAGVDLKDVKNIIAVGNPAMHHLLLSLDVETLARAPFLPLKIETEGVAAKMIGLSAAPEAIFKFMPNVAGFVGSDALAVILSSGMDKGDEICLAVDIGTNGEIALGSGKRILAASCACGPAFEGWHIKCGMAAAEGAISGVSDDGKGLKIDSIGSCEPRGICGSGLIDVIALMLDNGSMDPSGKVRDGEFTVYEKGRVKITVCQEDVRQIQLAKAAISAGIDILCDRMEISPGDIERVIITGAFGGKIDKQHALRVGLLPKGIDLKRVTIAEDGALEGAKMMLAADDPDAMIKDLLARVRHIPLHNQPDFNDLYTAAMRF